MDKEFPRKHVKEGRLGGMQRDYLSVQVCCYKRQSPPGIKSGEGHKGQQERFVQVHLLNRSGDLGIKEK